jgi:hypothetical protein
MTVRYRQRCCRRYSGHLRTPPRRAAQNGAPAVSTIPQRRLRDRKTTAIREAHHAPRASI